MKTPEPDGYVPPQTTSGMTTGGPFTTRQCHKRTDYWCNCVKGHCVNDQPVAPIGWICPKCGRGNSPYNSTCSCVPQEYKVTV